jgi:hypothetical protein
MRSSTDMDALRATVSRREIISVEKATHIPAVVRRALTGDNLKCTPNSPFCFVVGFNLQLQVVLQNLYINSYLGVILRIII